MSLPSASSSSSAPPAPAIDLHVLLMPPDIFADCCNQEQDFTISCKSVLPLDEGRSYVGAVVHDNQARIMAVGAKGKLKVATKCKERSIVSSLVPVMLHSGGVGCFRITATSLVTGKVVWKCDVPYKLPAEQFPPAKLASTCSPAISPEDSRNKLAMASQLGVVFVCDISQQAVAQEKYKLEGEPITILFRSTDGAVDLQLVVQKAVNAASGEPLSFYFDRVWSLQKIAVIASTRMFSG